MQPFGNGRHPFDRLGGIFGHEFFELPANGIGGFIDHVGEFVEDPLERGQIRWSMAGTENLAMAGWQLLLVGEVEFFVELLAWT